MTKNDAAWMKIFDDLDVLQELNNTGKFEISAEQINEYREARLMTKFDHRSNLPPVFRKNHLSILPTSRGNYIIAPMDIYHYIEKFDDEPVHCLSLPFHIQSLNPDEITGEAAAISCAYSSGMIKDFLNEEVVPTVSGRMSSGTFSFKAASTPGQPEIPVSVEKSQIEIDGGYESRDSLCLIEAKNSISDDFLIRQLFYPFRLWSIRIKKKIRLVFMTYTNGIFCLYEYKFEDPDYINSIRLVQKKRYSLSPRKIAIADLKRLLKTAERTTEPRIPFPQADKFERVINLCELLQENVLTTDDITETYDFTSRQTSYYVNAGKYLGLIEKPMRSAECRLTEKGKAVFSLQSEERQLKIAEYILAHPVFADVFAFYFEKGFEPSRETVVDIMQDAGLFRIAGSTTYGRRAGTVLSWINWIIGLAAMSDLFN